MINQISNWLLGILLDVLLDKLPSKILVYLIAYSVMSIAAIPVFAVVMILWNLLLPEIFNLTKINFWQACGLTVLSNVLFGGIFTSHYQPAQAITICQASSLIQHQESPAHENPMF